MIHECIKCKARYEDEDVDPYYCISCQENNKILAKELDKRFIARPKVKSVLEAYEEAPKLHGFPSAKDFMV